jgi:hypothetical protein
MVLQVRPKVGDTLRVTIDQTVAVSGRGRSSGDSAAVRTSYRVVVSEVVQSADSRGAELIAVLDTVNRTLVPPRDSTPPIGRANQGAKLRLRMTPDGASQVTRGIEQLDPDVREIFSAMPGILPANPVIIGQSWVRTLPLPADSASGLAGGRLQATLHLDSLSAGGTLAWVSLTGLLQVPERPAHPATGTATVESGSMNGVFVLDRQRGVLAESRVILHLESVVAMPAGSPPLQMSVRVTQTMRTSPVHR